MVKLSLWRLVNGDVVEERAGRSRPWGYRRELLAFVDVNLLERLQITWCIILFTISTLIVTFTAIPQLFSPTLNGASRGLTLHLMVSHLAVAIFL